MKNVKKTVIPLTLIIITFVISTFLSLRYSNISNLQNLFIIPIVIAGYMLNTASAVAVGLISSATLFITSKSLNSQTIINLTAESIFFIVLGLAGGLLANLLKSKTQSVSIEKNQLRSLNKVSTNFIASLEPAAVIDQFTREARRLLAADASIYIKGESTNTKVLAEENISQQSIPILVEKISRLLKKKPTTPEPYQIENSNFFKEISFKSGLAAPVTDNTTLILLTREKRIFTRDEIELLSSFLDEAVIAINGANYFATKERQSRAITALSELNKAAASLADNQELLHLSLSKAIEIHGADAGAILVVKNGKLTVREEITIDEDSLRNQLKIIPEKSISKTDENVLLSIKKPEIYYRKSKNAIANNGFIQKILRTTGSGSLSILPLTIKNKTAGLIMLLFKEDNVFKGDVEELNILNTTASELSFVLYNSKLLSDIKNLTLKTVE